MINLEKLAPIIEGYKTYFPEHWKNEQYKWEAVKHFQDNWDIEAEDFGAMFKKATEKAGNLLGSAHSYPRGMILEFAKADNEAVRQMFIKLYDESVDLSERIETFVNTSEELRIKYNDGTWNNHYQNTNAISVYLWLRCPDKYYIYKYEIYRDVANELESSFQPKKRYSPNNIVGGYAMYDEICSALQVDKDIREMLDNALTENCYPDTNLKTLTIDFGFYLCRFYHDEQNKGTEELSLGDVKLDDDTEEKTLSVLPDDDMPVINTWLLNYNPSIWDWDKQDDELNYGNIKKIVNSGGTVFLSWKCASKKIKQGDRVFIIKLGSAPRGIFATGYATSGSFDSEYTEDDGTISSERLVDICITGVLDYHTEEILPQKLLKEKFPEQQWSPQGSGISIRPDAAKWLIENFGKTTPKDNSIVASNSEFLKYFAPLIQAIRELGCSATRKEVHEKVIELMDISEDELSITYEKTGAIKVLNQIDFARNDLAHEGLISSETKGIWALTELGMNIDMTMELAGLIHMKWVKINTAKRKGEPIPEIDLSKYYKKRIDSKYIKDDFIREAFITESQYNKLFSLILRKKNIILQGAPGVGKTFSAKRLAYSIIGEKNENRVCMVQFHQNYSYEDFIMGYRPNDSGGFDLQSGVFYNFCGRCKENPDKPYFFIIDEINRGNLSKIFGELLMLIETDKRGDKHKINLVYGGTVFYIPDNLYIIGMMNTADRSLAMIDYALRRRFSFYTMHPAFEKADENGFSDYAKEISCTLYHSVIETIIKLNKAIKEDSALGKGFEIGHSYFVPDNPEVIDDEWVKNVVEYEIIPLIEEYWFDNDSEREKWKEKLYQTIGEPYDE